MKKILKSLFVIGVVSAVTVGATRAWFTDQVVNEGNVVYTGELDVDLNTSGPVFDLSYVEPGEIYDGELAFRVPCNHDDDDRYINAKYRIYDELVSGDESTYNKLWVVAKLHRPGMGPADDPANYDTIFEGWLRNFYAEEPKLPVCNTHKWLFELKLHESAGNDTQLQDLGFNFVVDATQTNNPGWTE